MPYYNLYCSNERAYRWHAVDDIKEPNNSILQSIMKQIKEDISNVLKQFKGLTTETVTGLMEKYIPNIIGIQIIHCETCKHLQVDVIVNDQIKVREDLWRSYETDRFVRQFMGGK